jgi:hypothetical protein
MVFSLSGFATAHLSLGRLRECGHSPGAQGSRHLRLPAVREGIGKDGAETRMVNLRCVPEVDLEGLTITRVDGASF